MTREELISALERAAGPDRELDVEIARLAFPNSTFENDQREVSHRFRDSAHGVRTFVPAPSYTGSVDAALTLVPEGAFLVELEWDDEPADGIFYARVYRAGKTHLGIWGPMGTPLSPSGMAIALCIASLHAKAEDV